MNRIQFFLPFFIIIGVMSIITMKDYSGEGYVYLFFTITVNMLLYFGFRKNAIFFDTFIGVFMWLGFWFKTTIRIMFFDGKFTEGLGGFNLQGDTFDEALWVSSIAFLTLIVGSYLREKLFFTYPLDNPKQKTTGLLLLYKNHRKVILSIYTMLFLFIAFSNFNLGIYQRGEIVETILPFGLNGVYKWLLLFGMSSFAALILKYEFSLDKKVTYFVPFLTLIETAITATSLLSRGMLLNGSSLGYGMIKDIIINHIKSNKTFWFIMVMSFVSLFIITVISVNSLRDNNRSPHASISSLNVDNATSKFYATAVNRWIGIDGMLAVTNSDRKGWTLFKEAIQEKYNDREPTFYDQNLLNSIYLNPPEGKHFMALPGFIAFFYYPGSILFLVIILLILTLFASSLEILAYKWSDKNFILSALIAQVIAYRFAHFGYVPMQSYLLFGSIILNLLLIFILIKLCNIIYKEKLF